MGLDAFKALQEDEADRVSPAPAVDTDESWAAWQQDPWRGVSIGVAEGSERVVLGVAAECLSLSS